MQDHSKEEFKVPKSHHNSVRSQVQQLFIYFMENGLPLTRQTEVSANALAFISDMPQRARQF